MSCLFLCSCLLCFPTLSAPIKYPLPQNVHDRRDDFQQALVETIFSNTSDFSLEPIRLGREHGDTVHLLRTGHLDFCWAGADTVLMDEFTHVPFPIFKGHIGYRLILVPNQHKNILSKVHTVADLKAFTFGQGSSWAEVLIFRANGLHVMTSDDYPQLFSMLKKGRFDLFPRSILEIDHELHTFSHGELTIAEDVILKYDHAIYFYVSKQKKRLQQFMSHRLNELNQNGGFDKLFSAHYQATLDKHHVHDRRVIEIANPFN